MKMFPMKTCNLSTWISTRRLRKISDKKLLPPTFVIDYSQIEIVEKLNIWEFNLISILFGMSMLDLCVLEYLVR